MVDHVLFNLAITAKPADIPNELTIDISDMTLGDTLRVGDLRLPAGVTTDVDPEEAIAIAQITRATIEADEIAEADAELAAEQAEEGAEGRGRRREAAAGGRGRRRRRRRRDADDSDPAAGQLIMALAGAPARRAAGHARRPAGRRSGQPRRRSYAGSRHNVGADTVELLAQRHGGRLRLGKERALAAEVRVGDAPGRARRPADLLQRLRAGGGGAGPPSRHRRPAPSRRRARRARSAAGHAEGEGRRRTGRQQRPQVDQGPRPQ